MPLSERDQKFVKLLKWASDTLTARAPTIRSRTPSVMMRLLSCEGVRDILKVPDPKIPSDIQEILTTYRHLNEKARERVCVRLSKEWSP